jgi:BirA family biotin operon repressor/biotin-[acetyl-CoA-carboxylase] ligase
LVSKPDILIPEEIIEGLDTKIVGKKILHFDTIPSTNNYAKQIINKVPEGTVIIADVQTSGRGRKQRGWYSPKGGLWFSVVLFPKIIPQKGMIITMVSSLAVAQGIKEITGIDTVIKWPNDLLIEGRKVCGILTDIDATMDKINYSVVGIGININNKLNKDIAKTAITLKQKQGTLISRVKLLISILRYLDNNYHRLIVGDYNFIKNTWLKHSDIIGRKIRVQDDNKTTTGIVADIDDNGCILLESDIKNIRIFSGDVTYL